MPSLARFLYQHHFRSIKALNPTREVFNLRPSTHQPLIVPSFKSQKLTVLLHSAAELRPTFKMCYRLVERHAVCRCLYYRHSVDMCAAANQAGHTVQEKTILVGYLCSIHSASRDNQSSGSRDSDYADSGYGSRDSHRHSSSRHRR